MFEIPFVNCWSQILHYRSPVQGVLSYACKLKHIFSMISSRLYVEELDPFGLEFCAG